jgi:exosortase/archaeosortase family protein
MVASAIPIAILCNIIRVTGTATMYVVDKPELGQNFMHEFMGLVMLGPALLMFWALGWLLQNLFIEEETDKTNEQDSPPKEASA